jgi:peptidoglycan hydrolase CwlO-like protein
MTKTLGVFVAVVAMTALASMAHAQSKTPQGVPTKAAANGKGSQATEEHRAHLEAARQDLQKDQAELKRLEGDIKKDREGKNDADLRRDELQAKKLKADIQKDKERIKDLQAKK